MKWIVFNFLFTLLFFPFIFVAKLFGGGSKTLFDVSVYLNLLWWAVLSFSIITIILIKAITWITNIIQ